MNYKTKLSSIKLFAFDYDGVFTNLYTINTNQVLDYIT